MLLEGISSCSLRIFLFCLSPEASPPSTSPRLHPSAGSWNGFENDLRVPCSFSPCSSTLQPYIEEILAPLQYSPNTRLLYSTALCRRYPYSSTSQPYHRAPPQYSMECLTGLSTGPRVAPAIVCRGDPYGRAPLQYSLM